MKNETPKPRRKTARTRAIEAFILRNVTTHPRDLVAVTAKTFDVSKAAISRHVRNLIEEGDLEADGNTKNRTFHLTWQLLGSEKIPLAGLREDDQWRKVSSQYFESAPENVREIWEYGFTEMLNNAIDHSEGEHVFVNAFGSPLSFAIQISDDGIGIFRKIARACDLPDDRQSVIELAKGKFTTDPNNHSGEGIFFTSRCFEHFMISSKGIVFDHHERFNDEHWVFESEHINEGTTVFMEMDWDCTRELQSVFDEYATEEQDHAFNKTVVPVHMIRVGKENLVSRSQAKRLLARVEQFRTVILDFKGVDKVGQAFADQVFRVFPDSHPEVNLDVLNVGVGVQRMIDHVKRKR